MGSWFKIPLKLIRNLLYKSALLRNKAERCRRIYVPSIDALKRRWDLFSSFRAGMFEEKNYSIQFSRSNMIKLFRWFLSCILHSSLIFINIFITKEFREEDVEDWQALLSWVQREALRHLRLAKLWTISSNSPSSKKLLTVSFNLLCSKLTRSQLPFKWLKTSIFFFRLPFRWRRTKCIA